MNETQVTLVGNIGGGDPELRLTPSGVSVAKFRMAATPRKREGDKWVDGEPSWFSVTVWRQQAENVVNSLKNGMRVIVQGNLTIRNYETPDGKKGTSADVDATSIGVELTFATAVVTKAVKSGGSNGGQQRSDDAWGGAQPAQARPAQSETPPSSGW